MRRSDAPSQAKRPPFQTPFKKPAQVVSVDTSPSKDETPAKPSVPITVAVNTVRRVGLTKGRKTSPNTTTPSSPSSKNSPAVAQSSTTDEPKGQTAGESQPNRYYKVMWCKWSKKKHKTFSDGVLVIKDAGTCILKDMQAKEIGKCMSYSQKDLAVLREGNTLSFSGKEIEIQEEITTANYESGSIFLEDVEAVAGPKPVPSRTVMKTKFKPHTVSATGEPVAPAAPSIKKPRYAIDENSFVLYNPGELNTETVAVVMDPFITSVLQPHQREGILFMYNCVMGNNGAGTGCILADEMGLGKTLQAIALIWTLLKQSPTGKPATSKVIVVAPTSLTKNWENEVGKWLGSERLKPIVVGHAVLNKEEVKQRIKDFKNSTVFPLLIISYDQFRINAEEIAAIKTCNLVVCDEGHKLKNSNSKISKAINSLETRRRIVITGTPIQNDLDEFFAMVNLCNPGFMDYKKFKDVFARPILEGRDSGASEEQKRESAQRSAELAKRTERFIIRRTKELLKNYLPPRVEQIVFCRLAPLQAALYKVFLRSGTVYSVLNSTSQAAALSAITSLRKLCNHPALVHPGASGESNEDGFAKALELFPDDFNANKYSTSYCGKLETLAELLQDVRQTTRDRVVIVSNYTQILEGLCVNAKYPYLRLDGKTSNALRQNLVDRFNDRTSDYFVFLLSSKAGGVGFNLVGANRIVLFDPDWNPANDQQAMGRVWRYGQKQKVWIYRMISTGTIEEKIFQRQLAKEGLSNSVVDGKRMTKDSVKPRFSKEELRDIFSYNEVTICDTHELFACTCLENEEDAVSASLRRKRTLLAQDVEQSKKEMATWKHHQRFADLTDDHLQSVAEREATNITFVFEKETQKDMPDVDLVSSAGAEVSDEGKGKEKQSEEEEDEGGDERLPEEEEKREEEEDESNPRAIKEEEEEGIEGRRKEGEKEEEEETRAQMEEEMENVNGWGEEDNEDGADPGPPVAKKRKHPATTKREKKKKKDESPKRAKRT